MLLTLVGLWASPGYLAATSDGAGQQGQAPVTHENEPCTLLREEGYNGLSADHFLKRRFLTWDLYRRYRNSIEIIEYNALLSTTNPVFTLPRNVTEQDEVYLRLRGNTYAYNYVASWTASDLTRGDLMNVIGTSPTKGIFDVQTAEAATREATQNAGNAAQNAISAATDVASITTLRGQVVDELRALSGDTERGTRLMWLANVARRIAETASRIEALREQLQNVLATEVNGVTLAAALIKLEARLGELRFKFGAAAARAVSNATVDVDVGAVDEALAAAESAALVLPELMAMLRASSSSVLGRLERDVRALRASVQSMQEDVRMANERWEDLDSSEPEAAFRSLLSNLADLEAARGQIELLIANVERGTEGLSNARMEIGAFKEAGRMRDLCASVGRFRNQSVKVTITATAVTGSIPATATEATAGVPEGRVIREGTFEAHAPAHAHVKIGPIVSLLQNPEFGLETIASECPSDRQCFKPYIVEPHAQKVGAAVHVALFFPGRYYWMDSDPGDPYENASRHQFVPYFTFGFPSTEASESLLLGGGIDLGRSMSFLAGWHLGKVRRLADDFRDDADDPLVGGTFDVPTGTKVAVADIIDTDWTGAFYFSLSIDAASLGRIFNLGFGGTR